MKGSKAHRQTLIIGQINNLLNPPAASAEGTYGTARDTSYDNIQILALGMISSYDFNVSSEEKKEGYLKLLIKSLLVNYETEPSRSDDAEDSIENQGEIFKLEEFKEFIVHCDKLLNQG